MKNIILQHWTGTLGPLEKESFANYERYAKLIGADHKLVQGNVFRSWLPAPCQKLIMLDEMWDAYDNVLMVDLDMFCVKGLKENVFEVEGIGLRQWYQDVIFKNMCKNKSYKHITDINGPFWGGAFWKLTLEERKALRPHIVDSELKVFGRNFQDEGIMHRLATKAKLPQKNIPDEWCWGNCFPGYQNAKMIHIRYKFDHPGPIVPKWQVYNHYKREEQIFE